MQTQIILLCLIAFFLFFIIHWQSSLFSKSIGEPFEVSCSIGDRITPVFKSDKYDGKWSSSRGEGRLTKNGSSETLRWGDIPWKVREKRVDERESDYAAEITTFKNKKNKEFSVSFWIFTNAAVQTQDWQRVFCVAERDSANNGWWHNGQNWDRCPAVFLWCCNYKALHIRSRTSGNWNEGVNGWDWTLEFEKYILQIGVPIHVTLVFTGSITNVYYDGEHKGIIELKATPVDVMPDGFFMVGQNDDATPNSFVMKDVAIYNEPLSSKQVKCIYNETSADRAEAEKALGIISPKLGALTTLPPNLIDDFNQYKIITDLSESESSNSAPAVETQAVPSYSLTTTGPSSSTGQHTTTLAAKDFGFTTDKQLTYFQFNMDKKQYINIPKPLLWTDYGLTFSMWFRVDPKTKVWPRLFDFGNGPGDNNIVVACLYGGLQFYVFGYGTHSHKNWELNNMNNNTWNHLTWTLSNFTPSNNPPPGRKDAPVGQWKIYINGQLKSTYDNMMYPYSLPRKYNYVAKSCWTDPYKSDEYLEGSIGDFRIYNSVLNETEVKQVYEY